MAAGSVFAFWLVTLVLIVVPGADWAFTLSAGLRGRSIVPAVVGLVVGYVAITAVVAAGVGAVVARSSSILTGLTIVGGAYLIWHGATTSARPATPTMLERVPAGSDWHTLAKGVGVSGLNPKGLLIFLALLPQFTNPGWAWPVAGQIALLGLTFTFTCAMFYLCLGSFARAVLHTRPSAARAISRISGIAMVIIGAGLVIDRVIT
jgi:threonine/homoserine/homoserine lactone efflux protein